MKYYVWPLLNSFALAVFLIMIYQYVNKPKIVYIYNQKVFDGFLGKVELEKKLKSEQSTNRKRLDSLVVLIEGGRRDLEGIYKHTAETAQMREQEMSARYTNDIWKFINDGIADYGIENNFDFILGASGDGSLMYASKGRDITDELIKYLNKRYE